MPTRYYARFPERNQTAPKSTDQSSGPAPSTGMPMKTADWPSAGAGKGAGYNRATKADAVKTSPKQAGLG